MQLCVTGGCGFIGSHFIRRWLAQHPESRVTNLDCLTYAGSLDNLEEALDDPRHTHVNVDLTDPQALAACWPEDCDCVVHFAAQTHVDRSHEYADQFFQANLIATHTLMSVIARRHNPAHRLPVILISTDEVYGPTPDACTFGPDQPLRPTSPYAVSKAAADTIASAMADALGLDLTIVRSVNVYGPRQFPEKVIPLFVSRALAGETLPLYGDGRHRRHWVHVQDCAEAITAIIERPAQRRESRVWHIGSDEEIENHVIAERICELCGADAALIQFVPDRPNHDRRYALDFSATTAAFSWRPKTDFSQGLADTVAWIKDHLDWYHARAIWTPAFLKEQ